MHRRCVRLQVIVLVSLGVSTPIAGASTLCSGDSWGLRYSRTDVVNETSIETYTISGINHSANHPNCQYGVAPSIGAQAHLDVRWFSSCDSPVRTDTYHLGIDAGACCSGLGAGYYRTQGRHYYAEELESTTWGPQRYIPGPGGGGPSCNPCMPGYVETCDEPPGPQDTCGCCLDPCPIVIDRSRDGVRLSSADEGVLLDINGLGTTLWLGWPTSADDAWLALDRNGNGAIDDGSELFGNTRNLSSGMNAANGYEVLAELDENRDGRIDASDSAFGALLLWGDANRNGVSEPTELVSLPDAGIRELSLDYRRLDRRDRWGNRYRYRARVEGAGGVRASVDVSPVWLIPVAK